MSLWKWLRNDVLGLDVDENYEKRMNKVRRELLRLEMGYYDDEEDYKPITEVVDAEIVDEPITVPYEVLNERKQICQRKHQKKLSNSAHLMLPRGQAYQD